MSEDLSAKIIIPHHIFATNLFAVLVFCYYQNSNFTYFNRKDLSEDQLKILVEYWEAIGMRTPTSQLVKDAAAASRLSISQVKVSAVCAAI